MDTIDREQPDRRLGQLKDAGPGSDVEARIVRRALERMDARPRPIWAWALPSTAVAAAAVWLVWPTAPQTIEPGAYSAAERPARFHLGPHAVELAPDSRADFVATEPSAVRIALSAGAVDCAVEPLQPTETFEVETAHARVTVVGTRFEVRVEDDCTHVDVSEGTVRVQRTQSDAPERTLTAGEDASWCRPEPEPAVVAAEPPGEADMMRAALDAMARGETDDAIAKLRAYRAEHPAGEFVEDALFHEAALTIQGGDDAAARELVNQFEAQFPESTRTKTLEGLLQK